MGEHPKISILVFSGPILCLFVTQSKNILYLLHIQKWLYFNHSLPSTTIYLFFFLCLYRVLLRPGCLRRHNSGRRGRGGEALAQPPPPAHVFINRFLLCLLGLVCLNYCCLLERECRKFPALLPM